MTYGKHSGWPGFSLTTSHNGLQCLAKRPQQVVSYVHRHCSNGSRQATSTS